MFEREQKNKYGIENQNYMTRIHEKKVNKISEWNLLHDIIDPPKFIKKLNCHYSSIIHGYMNTRRGKEKLKNFQIPLESGCSSAILMGRIVEKLRLEKDAVMQWHIQDGNVSTNLKVKVYFSLPALSATNIVTWKCHVDESTKGRYNMILGRDILTELLLSLEFSEHVIEYDNETLKGSTIPMIYLGTYEFKDLNTGKLYLKNCLLTLTLKKYMSQNMNVPPLKNYV